MSKFWGIALAWLLAMALPVQGYATQTMQPCGPNHHQARVMGDHAGHGHASAHAGVEARGSAAAADKASPAPLEPAGKCSLCASCCAAAALDTAALTVALAPPDLPEVPTIKVAHDRVVVGGLERPPRASRA